MTILWGKIPKNGSNKAVALSAKKRKIPFGVVADTGKVVLERQGKRVQISRGFCSINDQKLVAICREKEKTREFLSSVGCNVTKGKRFDPNQEEIARRYASEIGYPIYIKPERGRKGSGVKRLNSDEEFSAAFKDVSREGVQVIVEKMFRGEEYRFVCVFGKVYAIVQRRPASIVGNGYKTIESLIKEKNNERKNNPASPPIKIDDVVVNKLSRQGMELSFIPKKGERIYLRDNSNISMGGDSIDFTDRIDPGYIEEINAAAANFAGLVFSGWDVLIHDISNPPTIDNWAVIEVNDAPMISLHHYPVEGQSYDIAGVALDQLFPRADNDEIVSRMVKISGAFDSEKFMKYVKKNALGMNIKGWIKKSASGRLEALFIGNSRWVGEMIMVLHEGYVEAVVDNIEVTLSTTEEKIKRFRLLG